MRIDLPQGYRTVLQTQQHGEREKVQLLCVPADFLSSAVVSFYFSFVGTQEQCR